MVVILNRIRDSTVMAIYKRYKLLYRNHDFLARRLSSKDTHLFVKADAKGERIGPSKEEEGNRSTVLRKLAIFTQQKSGTT